MDLASLFEAEIRSPSIATLPSSDREIEIQTFLRHETRHEDPVPRSTNCWAPNKPAIDFRGAPTFPEFVLVRLLEEAGWEARWIKNWAGGREFCLHVGRPDQLPPVALEMFNSIHKHAAPLKGSGSWDVFAWQNGQFLFIESKQRGSDHLNRNQIAFLEAALDLGIRQTSFAVVEYDAPRPSTTRAAPASGSLSGTRQAKSQAMTPMPNELEALLMAIDAADPQSRIEFRDRVAAFGAAAIDPLSRWLQDARLRRFAILAIAEISKSDGRARDQLRLHVKAAGPDAQFASDTLARIDPNRVAAPVIRGPLYQASTQRGSPPPSQGACNVLNRDGGPCNNPGRWPAPEGWSCTTHIRAIERGAPR